MNRDTCVLTRFALKSSVAERLREVNSRDRLIGSSGHRVICDWRFVICDWAIGSSGKFGFSNFRYRISSFHFRFVISELSKLIHLLT